MFQAPPATTLTVKLAVLTYKTAGSCCGFQQAVPTGTSRCSIDMRQHSCRHGFASLVTWAVSQGAKASCEIVCYVKLCHDEPSSCHIDSRCSPLAKPQPPLLPALFHNADVAPKFLAVLVMTGGTQPVFYVLFHLVPAPVCQFAKHQEGQLSSEC